MGEITFNLRLGAEQLLVNTSPIPAPLLFEPPFPPEGAAARRRRGFADLFEIAVLNDQYAVGTLKSKIVQPRPFNNL